MSYLTVRDIHEKTGLHVVTIRKLCRERKLPGVRVGGQWMFDPEQWQRFIEQGGTVPPPRQQGRLGL